MRPIKMTGTRDGWCIVRNRKRRVATAISRRGVGSACRYSRQRSSRGGIGVGIRDEVLVGPDAMVGEEGIGNCGLPTHPVDTILNSRPGVVQPSVAVIPGLAEKNFDTCSCGGRRVRAVAGNEIVAKDRHRIRA